MLIFTLKKVENKIKLYMKSGEAGKKVRGQYQILLIHTSSSSSFSPCQAVFSCLIFHNLNKTAPCKKINCNRLYTAIIHRANKAKPVSENGCRDRRMAGYYVL